MDTTSNCSEDQEISAWLDTLFHDQYIASWLLSRDPVVDTNHTMYTHNYFMGEHSCTTTQSEVTNMFHDASHGYGLHYGTRTTNAGPPNHGNCVDSSQVVYKCHENRGASCMLSVTGTAIPFEFLEPMIVPKYQVHRAYCFITGTELVMCECMWLMDKTSFVTVLRYPFNGASKKYMVRLRMYDSDSPPRNYELESALWHELPDCQYCIFRGAKHCRCSPSSKNRMKPTFSLAATNRTSQYQQDAWTVWQWVFSQYDSMLKKYCVHVRNHVLQISAEAEVYSRTLPCTEDHGNLTLAIKTYQQHAAAPGKSIADRPTCRLTFSLPIDEALNSNEWKNWLSGTNTSLKVSALTTDTEADHSTDHDEFDHKSQNQNSTATVTTLNSEAQPKKKRPRIKQAPLDEKARANIIEYYNHVSDMTWSPEQQVVCELCGLKYMRKFDLKRHIKAAHLMDRDFDCMICDKKFKRQEHLSAHIAQIHKEGVS